MAPASSQLLSLCLHVIFLTEKTRLNIIDSSPPPRSPRPVLYTNTCTALTVYDSNSLIEYWVPGQLLNHVASNKICNSGLVPCLDVLLTLIPSHQQTRRFEWLHSKSFSVV